MDGPPYNSFGSTLWSVSFRGGLGEGDGATTGGDDVAAVAAAAAVAAVAAAAAATTAAAAVTCGAFPGGFVGEIVGVVTDGMRWTGAVAGSGRDGGARIMVGVHRAGRRRLPSGILAGAGTTNMVRKAGLTIVTDCAGRVKGNQFARLNEISGRSN